MQIVGVFVIYMQITAIAITKQNNHIQLFLFRVDCENWECGIQVNGNSLLSEDIFIQISDAILFYYLSEYWDHWKNENRLCD